MAKFKAQALTNAAWAFADVDRWDALLFAPLARASQRLLCEFSAQVLITTAWAVAFADQLETLLIAATARVT